MHNDLADVILPDPCAIVIFGATGDLTQRIMLPTLHTFIHDHPDPRKASVFVVLSQRSSFSRMTNSGRGLWYLKSLKYLYA